MVECSAGLSIVDNLSCMVSQFTQVATNDPLAAVMLAVGTILFVVSVGFFAYLTLGAAIDWITPESTGRRPPQRG